MYLLKGIGNVPVSNAECAMLALAIKHGYEIPEALLEVLESFNAFIFKSF